MQYLCCFLTNSIPILGPQMRDAFFGQDSTILSCASMHSTYSFPNSDVRINGIYSPDFLYSTPMVMAITGAIMLTGGYFP